MSDSMKGIKGGRADASGPGARIDDASLIEIPDPVGGVFPEYRRWVGGKETAR